ncbi:glycosyltransferase [Enterobacter mori]|uniref:glycosyltransferase n=1 Tax=Enterobacter mori TaxID=539813 RepID=UPI003F625556
MNVEALFVTVSYNNTDMTLQFIESWLGIDKSNDNILIVVDNSKAEDCILKNEIAKYNNVYYVRQLENHGYMAGCNHGLEYAKSELKLKCEVIVYSNNDITFESPDIISKVFHHFHNDDDLAVIAPSVWDAFEDKEFNPFMVKRPSLKHFKRMKKVFQNYTAAKVIEWVAKKRPRKKKGHHLSGVGIYAPHGSIFILNANYFYDNLPDDKYFLYGEEITVGEFCYENNKTVEIDYNIKIKHHSHSTTGRGLSKFTFMAKKNAIAYLMKKYRWI